MEVNYVLILVAAIAQFVLGALWYSPLMFGKWWMQIMEATNLSKDELKKMQKEMAPFYALQFFLTLLTTYALANFMVYGLVINIYLVAFWVWLGFIAPVQVSTVVWGNTKKKFWVKQIFVMLSMQLVGIMIAVFILSL